MRALLLRFGQRAKPRVSAVEGGRAPRNSSCRFGGRRSLRAAIAV